MMKIVQKPLPNGRVAFEEIASSQTKRAVMLLNENLRSLASQLAEAQRALVELQGRTRKTPEELDAESLLATAAKDATSKASKAKSEAVSEATEAAAKDATSKANAAKSEAVSEATETAAKDATSKANAAKSAAIATAATNAQNKVDAHANNDGLHVTKAKQDGWNAKYDKPNGGIPKTDLASAVQDSLAKADKALTSISKHASSHKTGGSDALAAADVGAAPANYSAVQSFSTSVGNVNASANATATVNVARTGYTPVLVGYVSCRGQNTRGLPAAYRCVGLSLSGSQVSLTLGATMNQISDTVTASFSVLYLKS